MTRLIRAEVRKLLTTRMLLGLTLGGIVLVAFYVVVIVFTAGNNQAGTNALRSLSDPGSLRAVYGVPFEIGYLMPLIMGVILISGEFRHKTITPTLLVAPRRSRVLTAKAVVAAGTGLAMGLVYTAIAAALGAVLIAARGYPVHIGSYGIPRMLVLMVLGLAVWAVFGLGFGALLKNQTAAVLAALAIVTIVEGLLELFLRWAHLGWAAKVLPSAASSAMVQASNVKAANILPWWGGALTLLAWGVLMVVLGAVFTMRRDVT
ncbi:MAG TPA: ABC transporter permease subunit [Acidimicrobiales bacterium]|nr:ABC transporter permease subunit [Acidimicrobiales bacterium]